MLDDLNVTLMAGIGTVIICLVVIAIVFRVPQIKQIIIGA